MLTVIVPDNNPISQDYYDSVISDLQFQQLTCSCGHSACLIIHGYYERNIRLPEELLLLRIMRLICNECGKTHAILLSSFVPYSQIRISDHLLVISAYENGTDINAVCEQNPFIDENNVKSIIRKYTRHWVQRLLSESIPLFPVAALIRKCFAVYSMQFMQIRRTFNSLYPNTT